jgi:hypothetical protein
MEAINDNNLSGVTSRGPLIIGMHSRMKYWKSSLTSSAKPVEAGAVSQAMDSNGRMIWIADAHRDDGKRFVVRAEEKLTAFMELELAIKSVALLMSLKSAGLILARVFTSIAL